MIDNSDRFFDDLPTLSASELKKSGGMSFISKKQRLEMELARIQERE